MSLATSQLQTPVIFLVFNRPDCTARAFERIRAARPVRLFIVADGPRADRGGEAEKCAEVRRLIEQGVDWPCEVVREYATANLGLARRVSSGLDAVFARETEAIILEDDCVADPTFFRFCAELLERYRDEPKVGQISGSVYHGVVGDDVSPSYYFSRYPDCWGWATWRRAWRHYDHTMSYWRKPGVRDWLAQRFKDPAERRYWAHGFDATAAGRMDSWGYRWILVLWEQDCLSIVPYRNLISNIGFGSEATHTREATALTARPVSPMPFPLVHPKLIAVDAAADDRTSRSANRRPSLVARIRRRIRAVFSRPGGGA